MTDSAKSGSAISKALIFYDGLCGFCNWIVRWIIKRDLHDRFRFAPQQSAIAEAVLARHGVDAQAMAAADSVFLVVSYDRPSERLLCRSDAGVQVLLLLGGEWAILGRLLGAVPRFLRDFGYSLFARIRYGGAGSRRRSGRSFLLELD